MEHSASLAAAPVIKEAADEIERLRAVITEASTKLKLLYMGAGLGQTTGRAALDALSAEIGKLDAVTYANQQLATTEKP
jgi:hypothetical protein